jgi:hypothetical protein
LPETTLVSGLEYEPPKEEKLPVQVPFERVAEARSTSRVAVLSPDPASVPSPVVKPTEALV